MALGMRRPYTDLHSHSCIERGFRNRFNLDEALWSENALSTSRVAGHVDNAAAAESHTPPQTSAYRSKCVDYVAGLPLWQ